MKSVGMCVYLCIGLRKPTTASDSWKPQCPHHCPCTGRARLEEQELGGGMRIVVKTLPGKAAVDAVDAHGQATQAC